MTIIMNSENRARDVHCNRQAQEVVSLRNQHDTMQRNFLRMSGYRDVSDIHGVYAANQQGSMAIAANQAALLPQDAYRELDSITQRVFENDEGRGYLMDLMDVSRSINIGKTAFVYRQASDKTGLVQRSLSGQVPENISKTTYNYEGDPVPIFSTGYGREWREQLAFESEGFDAMYDDQYNATRDLGEDMAAYALWGDSAINVRSFPGQGIANHRNTQQIDLGSSGANVNLTAVGTAATSDAIVQFWTVTFAKELDDNYTDKVDKVWVSPQMRRRLQQPYSTSGQFKEGTLEKYILEFGRIKEFGTTFELGRAANGSGDYNVDTLARANQFFAYVKNQQVVAPIVGMGVSTIAVPRTMPMDNNNNIVMAAMGMRVRADSAGRSKVFFGSNIT